MGWIWLRATSFGWLLGLVLMLILVGIGDAAGREALQFPVGLGMGAGVGILQGRALARMGGRGGAWAAASAGGLAAPFLAWDLTGPGMLQLPYELPLLVVCGGLLIGALQFPLLRPLYARAGIWVLACPIGWALAGATVPLADRLPRIPGLVGALLFLSVIGLGGVLLGVVGGTTLAHLEGGEGGH